MFIFGTKALEQFVERVIEWPQYCNHILQISHLRGTHSELVACIERALVKISPSRSELDVGPVPAVDQHQKSIPAANMEVKVQLYCLVLQILYKNLHLMILTGVVMGSYILVNLCLNKISANNITCRSLWTRGQVNHCLKYMYLKDSS